MHQIRGNSIKLNLFVDANHAANMVTRRSYYGFLISIGKVPIIWYSKKKNMIKSTAFGAVFVAFQEATYSNRALQ